MVVGLKSFGSGTYGISAYFAYLLGCGGCSKEPSPEASLASTQSGPAVILRTVAELRFPKYGVGCLKFDSTGCSAWWLLGASVTYKSDAPLAFVGRFP